MEEIFTAVITIGVLLFAGFGWGQLWAERQIRKESAATMKGRMQVTMPVNQEDAAATLEMLSLIVKKVGIERKAHE